MLNSFFMALSMFSKLPVPEIDFDKANMKYALCFFPVIGLIIGFFQCLIYTFLKYAGFGDLFVACIITVLPVLITGGIHIDGFMDTSDARKSYGSKEKKLKILSDPHIGAFSVISIIVYMIVYFGAVYQAGPKGIFAFAKCFILSRALSGFAAVTFKCAKKEGLLFTFADSADVEFTRSVLVAIFVLTAIWLILKDGKCGFICILSTLCVFGYYRYFSYNEFGGITGDLEGYFLQICELAALLCAAVFGR